MKGDFPPASSKLGGILYVLLFIFLTSFVSAQTVERLDDKIAEQTEDAISLEALLADWEASLYVSGSEIKPSRNGSNLSLNSEGSAYLKFYEQNQRFENVELLKLRINKPSDIQTSLDLQQMISFGNLKYIVVIFTYDACGTGNDDCLVSKVHKLIPNLGASGLPVYYKLSIPQ